MARMSDEQERSRQAVEDALFTFSRMLEKDLPLLTLRVEQAKQRSGLDYLLDPALKTLDTWQERLEALQEALGQEWREGNRRKWK